MYWKNLVYIISYISFRALKMSMKLWFVVRPINTKEIDQLINQPSHEQISITLNKTSTPAVVIKSVNFSLITVTFQFWLTASWQGNYTCFWKGFVYILHGWFLSALLSHPSKQVHIITVTPKKDAWTKQQLNLLNQTRQNII